MTFTLIFTKMFAHGILLAAPLLGFFIVTIIVLGQIVGRLENWDSFNALYWSFITALTVGYGDLRPSTRPAKALSVLVAILGIMFTGIVVAITVETAMRTFRHIHQVELLTHFTQNCGLLSHTS